jgi:hypothetical protein
VGEEMRCSGAAVLVFIVLLVCVGLYHAYSRRRVIKQVKDEEVRQRVARDLFANQLAASFGSLTMDDATIRAAHKSLGEISPEIKVRPLAGPPRREVHAALTRTRCARTESVRHDRLRWIRRAVSRGGGAAIDRSGDSG